MFSVYKYLEYTQIIEELSKIRRISYRTLAQSSGIHTSYFSRVQMGHANFSSEQLYSLAMIFELKPEETEYLLLLGEYQRSGQAKHKLYLKKKIDQLRNEKLKLKEKLNHIPIVESQIRNYQPYYLESITAKIHMHLCLPKYRENPQLLLKKLNISDQKLAKELDKLKSLQVIQIDRNKITLLKDSLHLDEADPISSINHMNWRLEAINKISKKDLRVSDYHFTVNFTANEETKIAIKQSFKDFLVGVQKLVGHSSEEDVYTLTFDLFGDGE